jgi:hypothetical protein
MGSLQYATNLTSILFSNSCWPESQVSSCSKLVSLYAKLPPSSALLSSSSFVASWHSSTSFLRSKRAASSPNLRKMQKLSFEFRRAPKRAVPGAWSATGTGRSACSKSSAEQDSLAYASCVSLGYDVPLYLPDLPRSSLEKGALG